MKAAQGWAEIAAAAGRAVNRSISVSTAERYAEQGRANRLPVLKYGNGRVYMTSEGCALWAVAFLRGTPTGAREAAGRSTRRHVTASERT